MSACLLKPSFARTTEHEELPQPLQFLDREIRIRENADFAGDAHGLQRDILRGKLGVLGKRPRRRQRERTAGADGANAVIGFDHVAIAGNQKRGFRVRNNQERFEVPQRAVLAPFLRELDRGFRQIALMFLKLALKALEQRKRVRRRSGKTRPEFCR